MDATMDAPGVVNESGSTDLTTIAEYNATNQTTQHPSATVSKRSTPTPSGTEATTNSSGPGKLPSKDGESNTTVIAVAVAVSLVVLIVVILVAWRLSKKRKRRRRKVSKGFIRQTSNEQGNLNKEILHGNDSKTSLGPVQPAMTTFGVNAHLNSGYSSPELTRFELQEVDIPAEKPSLKNAGSNSEYATPELTRFARNGINTPAVKPPPKNAGSGAEYATPELTRFARNGINTPAVKSSPKNAGSDDEYATPELTRFARNDVYTPAVKPFPKNARSNSEYATPELPRFPKHDENTPAVKLPEYDIPKLDDSHKGIKEVTAAMKPSTVNVHSNSEYDTPEFNETLEEPKTTTTTLTPSALDTQRNTECANPELKHIERIEVNGDMYAVVNKNDKSPPSKDADGAELPEIKYMDPEALALHELENEKHPDGRTEYATIAGVMEPAED